MISSRNITSNFFSGLNSERSSRNNQTNRMANIDLLRFLCSVFVIIEHFCEASAQNAFEFAEMSSSFLSYPFLRIIYSLARVAVPVFILLSGYCSIESTKAHIGKVLELMIMVICFQTVKYFANVFFNNEILDAKSIIMQLLPKNYYVYLYLALYVISPFINKLVDNISINQYKRLICILIFLFIIWSTFINTFISITGNEGLDGVFTVSKTTTDMGFSICVFVVCYLIGGYIKKRKFVFNKGIMICIIGFITLLTAFLKVLFPAISKAFLYYDSVFVISEAILMVILFTNIKINTNRIITFLAKNTLGVFLIHAIFLSLFAKRIFNIENMIKQGFMKTVLALIITVGATYICSLVCSAIYNVVTTPLMKRLNRSRIGSIKFFQ